MKEFPLTLKCLVVVIPGLLLLTGCPKKDSGGSASQSPDNSTSASATESDQPAKADSIVGEGDKEAVKAVSDELTALISAAAPATCGVAMLVPLNEA